MFVCFVFFLTLHPLHGVTVLSSVRYFFPGVPIFLCQSFERPETHPWWTHVLTRTETYQLHCSTGVREATQTHLVEIGVCWLFFDSAATGVRLWDAWEPDEGNPFWTNRPLSVSWSQIGQISAGVSCRHKVSLPGGIKTGGGTSFFFPLCRTMLCSILQHARTTAADERAQTHRHCFSLFAAPHLWVKKNPLHASVCREILTPQTTSAQAPHSTNSSNSSTKTCTMGPSTPPAGCSPWPSEGTTDGWRAWKKGTKSCFSRDTCV